MKANQKLLDHIESESNENMDKFFLDIYKAYKNENDDFLKNWKKIYLARAIGAFHRGWLNLCKYYLKNSLEKANNISHDRYTIDKVNEEANMINEEALKNYIATK
ncbi:hypothetical protein EP47_02125 [Legionella norrlandica]|uniref:Uncharacterized protein n=1 Tax=Legionella norrlandica TaxID=1498499 RepID=A0A0A2SRP8_9GAMM|nr:hypothetical protein [Legionella norrlandica]KGP62134.1 hypothetical protein EP47_02125 [Legionella norrlandica]